MARTSVALLILVGLGIRVAGASGAPGVNRAPNVVILFADDLGYGELGCYGGKEIPTPNIDSIATAGVRFTNGYVSCPVCSPTRAGLMTGRYQQRFGHEFNPGPPTATNEQFGLALDQKTIANYFKEANYATGMVGKWHLGYRPKFTPTERGFDEFFGFLGGAHPYNPGAPAPGNPIYHGKEEVEETDYLTEALAREATAFVDRHKAEPFFLYVPFNAVHAPLQAPRKYMDRFAKIDDNKRRTFAAMLSAMDDAIGAILQRIRDDGLEENTVIVFLSDNGGPTASTTSKNNPLRGFKGDVCEGGIRIPFLMQWKGTLASGKVYDEPVIALDILPTTMAAAGHPVPSSAKLDGVDLLPFLKGEKSGSPHTTLFWRFGESWAVRKGDWKLFHTRTGPVELVNLKSDVSESSNVAREHPEIVKELQTEWDGWNQGNVDPQWKRGQSPNPGQRPRARRRAAPPRN